MSTEARTIPGNFEGDKFRKSGDMKERKKDFKMENVKNIGVGGLKTSRGGEKTHGGEQLRKESATKKESKEDFKDVESKEWKKDWKEGESDKLDKAASKEIGNDILGEKLGKETTEPKEDTKDTEQSESKDDEKKGGILEGLVEGAKAVGSGLKTIGNALIGNTEMKDSTAEEKEDMDSASESRKLWKDFEDTEKISKPESQEFQDKEEVETVGFKDDLGKEVSGGEEPIKADRNTERAEVFQDPKEVIIENDKMERKEGGEDLTKADWPELPTQKDSDNQAFIDKKSDEGLKDKSQADQKRDMPLEGEKKEPAVDLKSSEQLDEGAHMEGFQHLEGVKFLRPGEVVGSGTTETRGIKRRRGKGKTIRKPKVELKGEQKPKQELKGEEKAVPTPTPLIKEGEVKPSSTSFETSGKEENKEVKKGGSKRKWWYHRNRRGPKKGGQEKDTEMKSGSDIKVEQKPMPETKGKTKESEAKGVKPLDTTQEEAHLEGFQQLEGVKFMRPGTEVGPDLPLNEKHFAKDFQGDEKVEKEGSWTESSKDMEKDTSYNYTLENAAWKGVTPGENRADLQGMRDKEKKDDIMEKLEGDRDIDPESSDSIESAESLTVDESLPEGDVSKVMFPTTHVPAQGAQPIKGVIIPEEATDEAKLEELNKILETEAEKKAEEPYIGMPSQQIINETTKADEAREVTQDLQSEGKETPSS